MARFQSDAADPPREIQGWKAINPSREDGPTKDARVEAERAVADLLQCDQILVLCGLGTSLCIKAPPPATETLFPTMNALWTAVREAVGAAFFDEVRKYVGAGATNIEDLLSRCQMRLALRPIPDPSGGETNDASSPDVAEFLRQAEKVIRTECRKALDDKATAVHEDFLRRLVQRPPRRPRANLFTTNYDLCFEIAAARIGLPIIDGFSFTVPPRFQPEVFDYDIVTDSSYSKEPDFVPRLLRLFKLHGSVDWHPADGSIIKNETTETPILIYPQAGKYQASYSPPFLEVMSRYQGLLRQRNIGVLAVGCGFNDLHIAEPLLAAVKSNPGLRLLVCAPDLCAPHAQDLYGDKAAKGTTDSNQVLRQFDHLIENGDARVTFLSGYFQDLVRLMPTVTVWTEGDRHETRIRKLEQSFAALKKSPGTSA